MKKNIILPLIILHVATYSIAQVGRGVYRFLELPVSARISSIGGTNVSIKDNDINFAFNNPSLLTQQTSGVMGLNYANYLADIKYGSAIYAHNINEYNYLSMGVQYIDYGLFDGYDENRNSTGTFTAKDMALYLTYARPLSEKITIGTTLKPIFSALERYTSIAIATDIGIHYQNKLLGIGLVAKNIGTQLKSYYQDLDGGQHREPLPFDLQMGISKKFQHAPIRLSITLHNLHRWNLDNYQSELNKKTSIDGTIKEDKITVFDMAIRHAIVGIEFTPTDNFYLSLGYNHRRHQEMGIEGYKSMAGFSFGGGIKLYKFQVGFGMTQYQLKNYAYHFSITTNLNDFISF